MDRRRFLHWLTGSAAGVALAPMLDVERLLWVPGARTIWIPPARAANTLITPDWIVQQLQKDMDAALAFSAHLNRRYDDDFVRRTPAAIRVTVPRMFV